MKKSQIVGLILAVAIIVGLGVFASLHKYEDSHLRVEGIRVNVDDYALTVDNCSEENAAMCKKMVKVGEKEQEVLLQFKNFEKSGYPKTLVASINGHEFFKDDTINLEANKYDDYYAFLYFNVINDEYISFSVTKGVSGRATTLYIIDMEGNIVLKEYEIDNDNMVIKDYDYENDFMTFKDGVLTVTASRLNASNYLGDDYVCNLKSSQVVEATYAYTYKDGEFSKKQTSKTTAAQFIKDSNITCQSKD
ncbi:MAG: hypothetical protein K2J20_01685 [Bacilli bacterium]|nr:hypothetical protein [Bacilli bacterium]